MLKSIRWRLLLWYAGMLLVVIVGFATTLYWSAERAAMQHFDARLEGAARYLEAALRPMPMRAMLRNRPMDGSFGTRDGNPRDGFNSRSDGLQRDFNEKSPPDRRSSPEKRGPDKYGPEKYGNDGERRPPPDRSFPENDHRPPDGERRPMPPPMRGDMERGRRELSLKPASDNENNKEPLFFTIFREDGTVFKSVDDPITNRDHDALESRLHESDSLVYYDSASTRLVLNRGPERSLVLVGVSTQSELARLDTLLYQLIGSGALALTLGVLGSWFISGRINKPLRTIATTASRLSATNLEERIDTGKVDTELVEVASVLNDAFDRLESAFQRQSRFTADAGHELRTPLAVLHTNLELALARPRKEEEYQETLKNCLVTSSKMRSLVDALLMLSRVDAGQLQANFLPIDLRHVVENCVEQHQPRSKGIQLSAKLPETPIMIHGDSTLLSMVINNLICNALRYTDDHGHVTVSVSQLDGQAQLMVEDDGIGIPVESQPHLFERFFRIDQSRNWQTGGYGLGLAICKSLVEAHQGTIRCESTPGKGTKFIIQLPVC
jgi:two-component system, OmpR family, sensor kinase